MDDDFACHCILVMTQGAGDGILIESEGYKYARYAAYWDGGDEDRVLLHA